MRAQLKITLVPLLSHALVMCTKSYLTLFIQPSQWNNLKISSTKFGSVVRTMNSGQNSTPYWIAVNLDSLIANGTNFFNLLPQEQLYDGQFSIFA
jgi:hypothetical protein